MAHEAISKNFSLSFSNNLAKFLPNLAHIKRGKCGDIRVQSILLKMDVKIQGPLISGKAQMYPIKFNNFFTIINYTDINYCIR